MGRTKIFHWGNGDGVYLRVKQSKLANKIRNIFMVIQNLKAGAILFLDLEIRPTHSLNEATFASRKV